MPIDKGLNMFEQSVRDAVFHSHPYSYLILDESFEVLDSSCRGLEFLCQDGQGLEGVSIFELFDELIGLEEEMRGRLYGYEEPFYLPSIAKGEGLYIDLYIHHAEGARLVILIEDVTQKLDTQSKLLQAHHEKSLLLEELAIKNQKLTLFNQEMQELVKIETKKNLEKQKLLELKSRHAQMGEMIGMITHQWRQPLNTISLYAAKYHILCEVESRCSTTLKETFSSIQQQVGYMSQTIVDFQNFFNPIKEKMSFNIFDTVSTVIELVRDEYRLRNIILTFEGDKEIVGFGFPNEYQQVTLAILTNAKDAHLSNPKKSSPMEIKVKLTPHEGRSLLTIEDNAGGIASGVMDTLFELYITTKPEGSGLGLNIAKSIMEHNMDGRLYASNTLDGAMFSVEL